MLSLAPGAATRMVLLQAPMKTDRSATTWETYSVET